MWVDNLIGNNDSDENEGKDNCRNNNHQSMNLHFC